MRAALDRAACSGQNLLHLARSFDFESKPRLALPDLPTPPMVVSQPCSRSRESAAARPKAHDLTVLRTSGYLDRLGFDYRPATASAMFREPTKIEALLRAGR